MLRRRCLIRVVLGLGILSGLTARAADEARSPLKIVHENRIAAVYIGDPQPDGKTEMVFEFIGMQFSGNQRMYSCIAVNGRLAWIKEYNTQDSYVRAHVDLGDAQQLTMYSGTLEHPEKLDPHDHAALWKGFVDSDRKPFVASRADLPKWWVSNPIREKHKKQQEDGQARKLTREERFRLLADNSGYPRIAADDRPLAIAEALNGNFRATWGLAISGYSPEVVATLSKLVSDKTYTEGVRGYAAMGLQNCQSKMTPEERDKARAAAERWLNDSKLKVSHSGITLLLDLGGVDFLRETLGKELENSPYEIDVMQRVPGKEGGERLWAIYQANANAEKRVAVRAAWALLALRDRRGVDGLLAMLPREQGLGDQERNNIFNYIAMHVGENFGYPPGNYREGLDAAAAAMAQWWQKNRDEFGLRPRRQ